MSDSIIHPPDTAPESSSSSSSKKTRTKVHKPQKTQQPPLPKPIPTPYIPNSSDPSLEESQAVHEVYEAIAPHFSQTRSKPWPLIERFLKSLPPNTIGLDSGAGNGKYLPIACERGNKFCIALDRSSGLLGIAQGQVEDGGECLRGDLCFAGWRRGVFDWAISVAAIHHLSTDHRRIESVQELIRPLVLRSKPPYSRFVIYVWAYEQGEGSKRKMGIISDTTKTDHSIPHPDPTNPISPNHIPSQNFPHGSSSAPTKIQDVLVPWVYKSQHQPKPPSREELRKEQEEPKVFRRYYHLFVEGELRGLVERGGAAMGFQIEQEDDQSGTGGVGESGKGKWLNVLGVGWEADNWWLEGEVGEGSRAE